MTPTPSTGGGAPKILTPTEFRRIGELIGGQYWQHELARLLKKHIRSIQNYAAGDVNVPATVRDRLAAIAAIKAEELMDVARDLVA